MKLKVHLIAGGRYYKAGEEIPDEEVSPRLAKYAVTLPEDGDTADLPELEEPAKRQFKTTKRAKH